MYSGVENLKMSCLCVFVTLTCMYLWTTEVLIGATIMDIRGTAQEPPEGPAITRIFCCCHLRNWFEKCSEMLSNMTVLIHYIFQLYVFPSPFPENDIK